MYAFMDYVALVYHVSNKNKNTMKIVVIIWKGLGPFVSKSVAMSS